MTCHPCGCCGGPTTSTTTPIPSATTSGTTGISPFRQPPSRPQSQQDAHDIAINDCKQMWDSATHMTKQEWSRTCKRVQTRLDNLNVESLMPKTKTTSEKSADDKKQ